MNLNDERERLQKTKSRLFCFQDDLSCFDHKDQEKNHF
jgi:hypothetical protein